MFRHVPRRRTNGRQPTATGACSHAPRRGSVRAMNAGRALSARDPPAQRRVDVRRVVVLRTAAFFLAADVAVRFAVALVPFAGAALGGGVGAGAGGAIATGGISGGSSSLAERRLAGAPSTAR